MKILCALSLFVCISYSQVEETYQNQLPDSTTRFQGIVPPVEFQYNPNEIFSKPIVPNIPDNILFNDNPSTVWLRTELLIMNHSQSDLGDINTHFTSPLYQQYLRDSEFDMVRYVLGAVQAGAVGYMAYRHIKKYGFWK
ncbi:MAG: hypothetical protein IH618_11090 [Ignavibacteriaceae bacterium]|nr:hypothetical protein [Ignavibacteriaceae bacterium]